MSLNSLSGSSAGSLTFCFCGQIEDGLDAQAAVEVAVQVGLGELFDEIRVSGASSREYIDDEDHGSIRKSSRRWSTRPSRACARSPSTTSQRVAEARRAFALIDVREDDEWRAGHAAGAEHIGKGVIERDIVAKVPDKDERADPRTAAAAFARRSPPTAIGKMGYTNVHVAHRRLARVDDRAACRPSDSARGRSRSNAPQLRRRRRNRIQAAIASGIDSKLMMAPATNERGR